MCLSSVNLYQSRALGKQTVALAFLLVYFRLLVAARERVIKPNTILIQTRERESFHTLLAGLNFIYAYHCKRKRVYMSQFQGIMFVINQTLLCVGPTFAESLGRAGYAVGIFGKYLNLSPRQAPSGSHTYFVNPGPMAHSAADRSGEYYPEYAY